jgi:hypothetical protein
MIFQIVRRSDRNPTVDRDRYLARFNPILMEA